MTDAPRDPPQGEADPRRELAALTAALRAHLEVSGLTGAYGLPAASRELAEARAGVEGPEPVRDRDVAANPGGEPGGRVQALAGAERSPAPTAAPPDAARVAVPAPLAGGASSVVVTAHPSGAPGPGAARLQVLASEVAACTRCRLHETRKQTVFARGTGESGLCFVGEGPGADEDEQGEPFVGKAGQLLDRMIEAMGFTRDEVYVCNVVKCRPPKNRKPEPDEMAACTPYVTEQLELIEPKVIVALGATAVLGLLGLNGIMRLRGNWRLYKGKIPVMPTYHPAYLLRTPEAKREVWQDLQEVLKHLGRTAPPRR